MKLLRKPVLLIAVAAALSSGIGSLWLFYAQTPRVEVAPTSIEEFVDSELLQPEPQLLPSGSLVPESVAAMAPDALEPASPVATNDPALIAQMEQISLGLKQQNDALLYFDDRLQPFHELLPKLESSIAHQRSVVNLIEQRFENMEITLAELSATLAERRQADAVQKTRQPPFRLIAIDRWNNKWNAVIELAGKMAMIEPHASRAGWLLIRVDPDARSAVFESESGTQVQLRVSG